MISQHATPLVLHIKESHYSFIAVRFNKEMDGKGSPKNTTLEGKQDQNMNKTNMASRDKTVSDSRIGRITKNTL